jgi:hypothetical protein
LVAGGADPPNVALRRVDTTQGSAQTLIRDVGWFFALGPKR